MLQQTRVAAVIPYYERFLTRFPAIADLAAAPERELLAHWSGLGYYSRARNLQKAAQQMVGQGRFPDTLEELLALAGIGSYTAAAVSSIAFGRPHAAIDGNVRRVIMRLANDAEADIETLANQLLDRQDPGRWNQAVMELGAIVCVPKSPACLECPLRGECAAFQNETSRALPPPRLKREAVQKHRKVVIVRKQGRVLLVPSTRVKGFWDLPEPGEEIVCGERIGSFRHAITQSQYQFEVHVGTCLKRPADGRWWDDNDWKKIPLSTTAKKALRCLHQACGEGSLIHET